MVVSIGAAAGGLSRHGPETRTGVLRRTLVAESRVVQSVSDVSSKPGPELVSDQERTQSGGAQALSSAQLGIWFAQKLDPSSPAYNIGEYIAIEGPIVLPLFERALRQVVAEAQSLRLQFSEQAGEPAQMVGEPTVWSLPIIDVSAEPDALSAATTWMKADLAQPIDPVRGPLFGFALFKASATRFFWYARYHHIVLDGFGMWLVARRVADVYTGLCAGRAADGDALGALTVLLNEDAGYLASEQFEKDRQYWSEALAARPEPGSLTLSDRSSVPPQNFLRETAYLPRSCEDSAASIGCSDANNARSCHVRGRGDLRASPHWRGRCRHRPAGGGAERGCAARPGNGLQRVAAAARRASGHAGVRMSLNRRRGRFASVCRISAISWRTCAGTIGGGDADGRTLFGLSINVMPFDYGFSFAGHRATAHNLSLGPVEDLNISVYDHADGGPLRIDVDGNPALHKSADLACHLQRFLRLLGAMADGDRPAGDLDLLEPVERDTILRLWNDTAQPIEPTTLPALFAAQALRTPAAAAVMFEDRVLSYAELDAHANRLAHHLQNLGVGPETVVALCVDAVALAVVQKISLGFPYWLTAVSLLLSIPLMLVGIRVLGETNWAPISALANLMQAVFAALQPGHLPINMIGSGMSGTVAGQGEHLMQCYRSGKIIGSNNRSLMITQLIGVPVGAAAVAVVYPALRQKYGFGAARPDLAHQREVGRLRRAAGEGLLHPSARLHHRARRRARAGRRHHARRAALAPFPALADRGRHRDARPGLRHRPDGGGRHRPGRLEPSGARAARRSTTCRSRRASSLARRSCSRSSRSSRPCGRWLRAR